MKGSNGTVNMAGEKMDVLVSADCLTGWLSPLVNAGEAIDVDLFLQKMPADRMQVQVSRNLRLNKAKIGEVSSTSADYNKMGDIMESGYYLQRGLNDGQEFFYMNVLVTVKALTKKDLDNRVNEVVKMMTAKQITLKNCAYMQEAAFLSTLPLAKLDTKLYNLGNRNILTNTAASTYMFTAFEICDDKGILIGTNEHNNSLVILDLFNTKKYKAPHLCIMGCTGSGKTYTLQTLATRMRRKHCPPLPSLPTEADWKSLFQNERRYTYSAESDKRTYVKRLTPVGCYYDAIFLKGLVPKFSDKDNEGVSYSRVCGVLMTPTYLLRVFHSRDVAMKFSTTGERNMRSLLLSDAVFLGYVPEQNRGVLVFGDDYSAAEKIIEYHVSAGRAKIPHTIKKGGRYIREDKAAGTMLGTTNLGNPLFYLPVERRALELLRIMQYPAWQDTFTRFINGTCFGQKNNTGWCYELDGRQVYILASLNLTHIGIALRNIVKHPEQPVTLAWLDWQHDFFERLIKKHGGYCSILIKRMTAEYDVSTRSTMDEYWRG